MNEGTWVQGKSMNVMHQTGNVAWSIFDADYGKYNRMSLENGTGGDMEVTVTITDGKISDIVVNSHAESSDTVSYTHLLDALLGTNNSPLKAALLAEKLGADIDMGFDDSTLQPTLELVLRGATEEMCIRDRCLLSSSPSSGSSGCWPCWWGCSRAVCRH